MFNKGEKGYSILNQKCPKCHEGDLFETKTFAFKKPFDMYKKCPKCNQKYVLEPGFYWGAMYVAYALSGGYMLGGFALLFFLIGIDIIPTSIALFVGIIPLYVWFFRTARAIWINFFIHYQKMLTQ
jgi:hypothetical protein